MPAFGNITVKKNDGTTDIVYGGLTPAGADGSPAVYRQDAGVNAALPVGLRWIYKLMTQWNGNKTARQTKINFVAPFAVQDTTTTKFSASDRVVFDGILTTPVNCPASHIDEAVSQVCNLIAAAATKDTGKSGYAPT